MHLGESIAGILACCSRGMSYSTLIRSLLTPWIQDYLIRQLFG